MKFEKADALNQAIRLVAIKHRSRAAALLSRLGLHPGQEIILLALDANGPCTHVQLASLAGCAAPSITVMAHKLEAAGLIGRSPHPRDARAVMVDLTAAGRALIPQLRALWQELADQTVAGLSATTVEGLTEALADLARSLHVRD